MATPATAFPGVEPFARSRTVASTPRAVVDLRGAVRIHQRHPRRHLGHLVAPVDRPRHVLDAGAHGDLSRRHRRGAHLRLGGAHDDVRRLRRGARIGRPLLGLPRAVRRVGLHLGRVRHGHLGAVRRLVAQRLRPRREDHQPSAHAAGGRHRRHPVRRDADGARVAEPRDRRPPPPGTPVSARRRPPAPAGRDGRHRAHAALGHAPGALLPGERGRVHLLHHQLGARIRGAMAGDDDRARLHGADAVHDGADAAVPGAAAARTDLRAGRPLHADRLPAAADRAGASRSTW